ncbi:disks large-associated protein 5 isoform X1 [Dromaius novaehollandiae]|uniref:disks large-associated protein 5 isoform X1 n=1 Tax=Dromaius novaehollandiae TaxID=8790 RepID=UPI003120321B
MAATSQFASRYKKDLSTETLRTKVARRKSVLQKENRHKLFEKSRQFGLADVNIQLSKDRGISQLNETSEMCSQENSSVKQKQPTNAAMKRNIERKEMLQRYKEEKELRKLKEQREKAKKGVFKVGLYRPTAPGFLSLVPQDPVTIKPKEKAAPAFSGRITRSKAKNQAEKTMTSSAASKHSTVCANGLSACPTQGGRKQMGTDKAAEKEKVLQSAVQAAANVRITRAAASAARQMLKTTAATATGNQPQRKTANVGKQKKAVKPDIMEVLPFKHEVDQNAQLDPAMEDSVADSKHSASVELQQEQTSVEKKNVSLANNSSPGRPRTRSFAPQNFVFQPLNGLATYRVTPMTPSRANAFLTPGAFWDFSETSVNTAEKSREIKAQEPDFKSQVVLAGKSIQEQQITTGLKAEKACELDENSSIQRSNETISVSTDTTALGTKSDVLREQEHDVPYFRNILQSETERLMSHCLQWDGKLELDIPEDAKDLIRTTIGQTRLLIAERFKQFEGLVDNCEFKRGEKETTCTDLDGFWDMVNFQIEDVNKKFDNLKKLQDNEWQPLDIPSKGIIKKKTVPNGVSKPKLGAAGRTAARNRLAAIKAAMRDKMKHEGAADCTHQEKPPEIEKVVFEGGFFRVESPVKSFPGLLSKTPCRSSQRTSEKLATPRSSSRALLLNNPSALHDPEDTTAKQMTPVLRDFHATQNLKMHQLPTRKALPSGFLEQSISLVAEERCPVAGTAEGTSVLENRDSELKVMDGMEEMETSAAEQGQDIVMHSPEKDICTETSSAQSGEPQIPDPKPDALCSDLMCTGRNPFDMPAVDGKLPFTPIKNKAQKFAAAETFSDLIVFSPLSPSGEK